MTHVANPAVAMQLPVWDHATDQLVMAEMFYEPARNPHMLRIELEDWPVPLDVPLRVLTQGLEEPTRSTEMSQLPMRDQEHVLWSIRWNLAAQEQPVGLRVLRVPRVALIWHLTQVTRHGARGTRVDWDGEYERLCQAHQ
ncbi:hypothetical protein ACU635_14535 [[Actinomadura] parvosata]|uniref:hypothetical protein n=1 Tax=[Actinomadura] parvosata TaxID=1955412 RepID=UPI00406C8EA0